MTRNVIAVLVGVALPVLIMAEVKADDFYSPDHIDLERREVRKALRSHRCFWYGLDCPGQGRRLPYRFRYVPKTISSATDAYCHRLIEATGEQAQSKDNAEERALRAWQGRVRFHFGEKYLDFGNARDKRITCSPSSVSDTVGGKIQEKLLGVSHYRCEISARPCREPARKVTKGDD
jgi:hypothetical protein